MRGLRAPAGSNEDVDVYALSFLDLLSCGLGGAILLFVVFLNFGSERTEPLRPVAEHLWYEISWSPPEARFALRLVAQGHNSDAPVEAVADEADPEHRDVAGAPGWRYFVAAEQRQNGAMRRRVVRLLLSRMENAPETPRLQFRYVADERWGVETSGRVVQVDVTVRVDGSGRSTPTETPCTGVEFGRWRWDDCSEVP